MTSLNQFKAFLHTEDVSAVKSYNLKILKLKCY